MNLRNKWQEDNKNELHIGGKYTKSTLFLLPILGVYYKDFMYDKNYLINCSINLENPKIMLILSNEDYEPITSLINRLTNDYHFSESWMDDENREIILSFDLEDFNLDFRRFLKGRYSTFSEGLKKRLVKCYGTISAPGYKASVYDAIVPTEEKRKALAEYLGEGIKDLPNGEVLDIPSPQIEQYYTYKNLEELYGVKQ